MFSEKVKLIFPKSNYTELNMNSFDEILDLIENEKKREFFQIATFEALYENNSYSARVAQILKQTICA